MKRHNKKSSPSAPCRGIRKGHLSSTTIRKHHSAFLMIQLVHLYTTTGKTMVLTLQTFVSNVTSLLLNMRSRFVMGFPGGSAVDNLSAMQGNQDTWVQSLGRVPWRRAWQSTPVFLPGESPGQRSLAGLGPWGRKEYTE